MSVRMNASLYSDVARIERGDYLLFHCEQLSQHERDVQRYFFGCYYPRWHGFYLEEVRSIVGNLGYPELKHFPAYPFDVYLKEDGETYLTDDFQVDSVLVLGPPQNQRDDGTKRYKVVSVDDSRLQTRTGQLPPVHSSSTANPSTMMTSTGKRVAVEPSEEVLDLLEQLRDAYVAHAGGGIPEIGIKAMGRPFRRVSADGRRWMSLEGIQRLVRDSRAFGGNAVSFGETQRSKEMIHRVADLLFSAFPQETLESGETVIDYDVFMDCVRGHMSSERKKAVWDVFRRLDFDNDGHLTILDIQARFNAQEHPVVVADSIFSADKLLKGFLVIWDENHSQHGLVPYAEFLDFYNGLSAVIERDDVFFSILQTTWKMPKWSALAQPPIPGGTLR